MNIRIDKNIHAGVNFLFEDIFKVIEKDPLFFRNVSLNIIKKNPKTSHDDTQLYRIFPSKIGRIISDEDYEEYRTFGKNKIIGLSSEKLKKILSKGNCKLWEIIIILGKSITIDHKSKKVKKKYDIINNNFETLLRQKNALENMKIESDALKEVGEYLYESILRKNKTFYKEYCEGQDIIVNYVTEVCDLRVCPCCGITPLERASIDFDHFFPLKYYPYLAINSTNLIGSCSICNGRTKLANCYLPILNPKVDVINDFILIQYNINRSERKITMISRKKRYKKSVCNYIKLYNLRNRYNEKNTADRIQKLFMESMSKYLAIGFKTVDELCDYAISNLNDQIEEKIGMNEPFLNVVKNFFIIAKQNKKSDNYKYLEMVTHGQI